MKRIFLFIVISFFLASCSSVLITGRKQLLLVSDAEVLSMSATAYKQFIDSVPASKDMANTLLIRKVGRNISAAVTDFLKNNGTAADTSGFKWEFNLVSDSVVNAFCMPGGKVVFYEGILPKTKDETGVAVVMGHEIAHAVAKHSNERLSQQMLAQYGASLADMLLSNKPAATRQTINVLYGLGANLGVILPYSRKHEYEADRLGLIFMALAGYDPAQAVEFWQRMAAGNSAAPIELLSTHPTDANRIAKLKELLPEAQGYYRKK